MSIRRKKTLLDDIIADNAPAYGDNMSEII